MSKFMRLLKSPKEKGLPKGEELQTICKKCGKRPAVNPDGLCNHCRFNDILTGMAESK